MTMVVEGTCESGIVTLKNKIHVPEKTEVLVVFKNRKSKKNFLKSAGSWKGVDEDLLENFINSRKNMRERGFVRA